MFSDNNPPTAKSRNEFPSFCSVVTVPNCWYYLSLLERFVNITSSMPQDILKLYLVRAEYRYFKWMYKLKHNRTKRYSVPPIDVAFFWQAHLLSPVRFEEDTMRMKPFTYKVPLKEIHEAQNNQKASILHEWHSVMGDEPYDLTIEALLKNNSFASFTCIVCSTRAQSRWKEYAEWRTDHTVALQCHCCNGMFTVKHVGKANLLLDIATRNTKISGLTADNRGHSYQPQFVKKSLQPAKEIMSLPFNEGLQPLEDYVAKKFASSDHLANRDRKKLINAIQSTYLCTPYRGSSLDLIQAVVRQYKFAAKVTKEINWYAPLGIIRGIRQYTSFLALIKENKGLIAVPTYEIDLAWHTHMLHHPNYRAMCFNLIGKLINHDDNIPESDLASYVKMTDIAWEKRKKRHRVHSLPPPLPPHRVSAFTREDNENKKTSIRNKLKSIISKVDVSDTQPQNIPVAPKNRVSDETFLFTFRYKEGKYQCPPQYTKDAETSTIEIIDQFDYDTEKVSFHDKREAREFIQLNNSDEFMDRKFRDTKKSVYGFIGTSTCGNTEILNQWTTELNKDNSLNNNSFPSSGYTKVFKTRGNKSLSATKRLIFDKNHKGCRNFCCIDKTQKNKREENFDWTEMFNAWIEVATNINEAFANSSCGGWGNCQQSGACGGGGGGSSACGGGGGTSACGGGTSSCGGGGGGGVSSCGGGGGGGGC